MFCSVNVSDVSVCGCICAIGVVIMLVWVWMLQMRADDESTQRTAFSVVRSPGCADGSDPPPLAKFTSGSSHSLLQQQQLHQVDHQGILTSRQYDDRQQRQRSTRQPSKASSPTTSITSHQSATTSSSAAVPATPSRSLSTLRIAFVDDETANCRLGARMLQRLGIPGSSITFLRDGKAVGRYLIVLVPSTECHATYS